MPCHKQPNKEVPADDVLVLIVYCDVWTKISRCNLEFDWMSRHTLRQKHTKLCDVYVVD